MIHAFKRGKIGALAVLANSENTHYLGFLHMELDPGKFIRHYEGVPGRVKGENTAAICRSYLADGYAADGQYEKAVELLSIAPPADNLAIRGLYAANLAGRADMEVLYDISRKRPGSL